MNLSIAEFGYRIGDVKKSTVNSWLRGLAVSPKDKVQKIAFIAGTTTKWILGGDEYDAAHCSCSSSEIGTCLKCLMDKKEGITHLSNFINSDISMTSYRKQLILQTIDLELDEINSDIKQFNKG
ncbi:hypothetical protein [Lysinibacillus sp. OL1]|uniref:hypothetical protein n=1 Tax=Lysinibacillus sp. OL1 TaxID=2517243 RepID=UPI00187D48DA|nr:hypothetical protein [Lysinibacillus sp. OL1]